MLFQRITIAGGMSNWLEQYNHPRNPQHQSILWTNFWNY
jgi:hypothetical protein